MLLATTRNFTEWKIWKSAPKKSHCKSWRAQKSVEKMQARGKTCFLQQTKNTTYPKVRKGASKIEPQMKHTNTATASKCNLAPRDDDTRWLRRPLTSFWRSWSPCMVASHIWLTKITNTLLCTREMQPCNTDDNTNPEILKAAYEIAVKGRRNDAQQRS